MAESLPPGLILLEQFVSEEYERRLLECIEWESSNKIVSQGTLHEFIYVIFDIFNLV